MKLCKDCKWHHIPDASDQLDQCRLPGRAYIDPIWGGKTFPSCAMEREAAHMTIGYIGKIRIQQMDEPCGKAARYWEAKS